MCLEVVGALYSRGGAPPLPLRGGGAAAVVVLGPGLELEHTGVGLVTRLPKRPSPLPPDK